MQTYILLGDPHLVGENQENYGQNPAQRLESIIDVINTDYPLARAIFILGDLAENGKEEEYNSAKKIFGKFKKKVFCIPGNHDNKTLLKESFDSLSMDSEKNLSFHYEADDHEFIGIDSTLKDSSKGVVCQNRLSWLEKKLSITTKKVIILMHHPALSVGYNIDSIKLTNSYQLLKILNKYKSKVKLLIFGHIHRNVSGTWEGFPFVTLRGTGHQRITPQKGNAGYIDHGTPSYAVLNIFERNIVVQFHDISVDRAP